MAADLLEFLRTHEEAFRSRTRLASLYSDFRYQRNANPDGFAANSSAWLRALSSAASTGLLPTSASSAGHAAPAAGGGGEGGGGGGGDRFVLHSGTQLLAALQTQEFGRPLALGTVVYDAVKSGELIHLTDFLFRTGSIYYEERKWVPSLGEALEWGLRTLGMIGDGSGGKEDRPVKGKFVILENLETVAKAVLEQASKIATSNTSRIFSLELFNSTFASALGVGALSPTDSRVLLTHLQRDRAAIAYSPASGVIKFKTRREAQPSPITAEDISIASLRTLIFSLEPQVTQLSTRISELDLIARRAVSNKQLLAAKTALRQKKAAETKLQQRSATLAQVEDVYAKIEQAADQVEMFKVMEGARQTLQSLNRQTGGVEKVQDVMEGLREEMMNADEIGQAINEVSAGDVDEGEIEDELEVLEKVEREKVEATEREEREKRQAMEVEQTRKKLAELGQPGEKKKDEDVPTEKKEEAGVPGPRTEREVA